MGLNILDVLFTIMILDHKGWEVNPFVQSAMNVHATGLQLMYITEIDGIIENRRFPYG
jgi:hypothetical protein